MYMVYTIEEDGRFYAWAQRVKESENLKQYFYNKNVISVNVIATKKRAAEIVQAWNDGFKEQGRYLFDLPF